MTSNSDQAAGAVPGGVLPALLNTPPATLFELALRWVPASTGEAYRIAALACAMIRVPADLTAARPDSEPAGYLAREFDVWLRDKRDATAEEAALRIFCLYFAAMETISADSHELGPAGLVRQVTAAADLLHRWFQNGKLRRPVGWRLR